MDKLFIIVTVNRSSYNDQQMITRNSDREVLSYVGSISSHSGLEDNIQIKRIFTVDECGETEHYDVKFRNGKLVLEALPEAK